MKFSNFIIIFSIIKSITKNLSIHSLLSTTFEQTLNWLQSKVTPVKNYLDIQLKLIFTLYEWLLHLIFITEQFLIIGPLSSFSSSIFVDDFLVKWSQQYSTFFLSRNSRRFNPSSKSAWLWFHFGRSFYTSDVNKGCWVNPKKN